MTRWKNSGQITQLATIAITLEAPSNGLRGGSSARWDIGDAWSYNWQPFGVKNPSWLGHGKLLCLLMAALVIRFVPV